LEVSSRAVTAVRFLTAGVAGAERLDMTSRPRNIGRRQTARQRHFESKKSKAAKHLLQTYQVSRANSEV
jgi:hypothetical protein